jgi:hypothetical protein
LTSNVGRYFNGNNYSNYQPGSFSNPNDKGILYQFFVRPNLLLEYSPSESVQQAPIITGATRRYLKLIVRNRGRGIAENCEARLALIQHGSTSMRQPSQEEKPLLWDTGEAYRTIGARVGSDLLYIIFSQDTFTNVQTDLGREVEDSKKIYAKTQRLGP